MKINPEQMAAAAGLAETMLKALANRNRLMILCQLVDNERSVGELSQLLALRDSTASQHLALLRKDGLVTARRDGQTIWYALAGVPVRRMVDTLYDIYCGPSAIRRPKAVARTKPASRRTTR